ncbi:putative H(+)-transporting two-sector ATPase [Dioscorea sansibarensis]
MEMKESGVINEKNIAESKVALVYGQMNEPTGSSYESWLTALTMAEYFRMLMNKTRRASIHRQYFSFRPSRIRSIRLIGRMPSAVVINPPLVQKWFFARKNDFYQEGSITSIQAVYVPADDLTDPCSCHDIWHI